MDDPRAFEELIAGLLRAEGYATELTSTTNDWGVDIFATRGDERIAVQVKMYAGARPVNRRQVFELHGAAAYFDCTGAVIATDGLLMADAAAAAEKLGIRVLHPWATSLSTETTTPPAASTSAGSEHDGAFERIWRDRIMPLAGRTLRRPDGSTNTIVAVDWGGITRITSNGARGHIPIEIFRWAVDRILETGSVTRQEINEQYEGRASSGVALILGQVPEFEAGGRPLAIRRRSGGSR